MDDKIEEGGEIDQGVIVSGVEYGSQINLIHSVIHPSGFVFKAIGLALLCFVGFGSYFCYDSTSALEDEIKQNLNLSTTEYMLLPAVYSWPNVILGFVGGFLIDRVFGIRFGIVLYMTLTLLGQLCFSTGVLASSFWIMLLGRFIFGIGAESLTVAQNSFSVLWFKGKVLNMVFGLQLSFARVGSTASFAIMESVYRWVESKISGIEGLAITFYLATLTCVFSFVCAVVLALMDRRSERILRVGNVESSEPVRLSDIKSFNAKFWILNVIIVFYYVAIFPFFTIGKQIFRERFHMSNEDADLICSTVYLISGLVSPIGGFIIDKVGRNVMWVVIGIMLTIVAQTSLTFYTFIDPHVGMLTMGISYSILASSLWPLISLVIPENQLGTAYGVCSAVQNLGLGTFSLVVGRINDKFGVKWCQIFFIGNLSISLFAALLLYIMDVWERGTLNMSPEGRLIHQQRVEIAEHLERQKLNIQSSENSSNEHERPSEFYLRNRYLSRVGAKLPASYNPIAKSLLR